MKRLINMLGIAAIVLAGCGDPLNNGNNNGSGGNGGGNVPAPTPEITLGKAGDVKVTITVKPNEGTEGRWRHPGREQI